jgi:ABC-type glycerol-3-phosphate transport system permease component
VLVVGGNFLSSALVAYGFARLRFPGRETLFVILLSTLMLPFFVRLIPLYIIFSKLGWLNTFLPLTVPAFFGGLDFSPFCIFLLRQFFRTVPQELFDAARIDGYTEPEILFRVVLPVSKPALAVITLFAFQQTWNDFLGPLVFLQDENLKTVSLGLFSFVSLPGQGNQFSHLMAASAVAVAPIVVVFLLFQRYFMSSFTFSGLKG